MTTSVCMGTYNGERFILEQLDTIRRQSKVPDEVIICDDCSTDTTVKIIKEFIEEHELGKSWKLLVNTENKGYPGNFYYAMSLCTKEVVFLADQDDIWDLHKIEEMCKVMEQNSKIKVLACKFNLIDENGNQIRTIMKPSWSNESRKITSINLLQVFTKYSWPGMVLAYKRKWYGESMEVHVKDIKIPHDQALICRSAEEMIFYQMDIVLSYHRRHDNNTAKEEHRLHKLLNIERKEKEIEEHILLFEEIKQKKLLVNEDKKILLDEKIENLKIRNKALQCKNIVEVIGNSWKYRKFFRIKTFICDCILCLR